MEWILAAVFAVGMVLLTTILVPFLGSLVFPICVFFGVFLPSFSPVVAGGAFIGCLFTFITNTIYLRTEGAMSQSPSRARNAAIGFFIAFGLILFLRFGLQINLDNNANFLLFLGLVIALSIINFAVKRANLRPLEIDIDNVVNFRVVEKYADDPKWAIYLYMRDGTERWNPTIPNSFRAKHPTKDLTFVFNTREDALRYASGMFSKAKPLD